MAVSVKTQTLHCVIPASFYQGESLTDSEQTPLLQDPPGNNCIIYNRKCLRQRSKGTNAIFLTFETLDEVHAEGDPWMCRNPLRFLFWSNNHWFPPENLLPTVKRRRKVNSYSYSCRILQISTFSSKDPTCSLLCSPV